jgi:methionyl-tRNA formyltransferase
VPSNTGDAESGVTVMRMEAGLDTGPMLLKVITPISAEDTGGSLHDRLAEMGPPAVMQAIAGLAAGTLARMKCRTTASPPTRTN